jgi:hypothetical protein
MRIEFATESLLTGELADRLSITPQPYGRTVCLVAFGRRIIVDFIGRR